MIRLIELTKRFRGIPAVDRLDLEVAPGTVYGFLGPNGAGKTTTIRMMAGVMKPTSGRILINNLDLAREPLAVKACVGYIPDSPFLYEKLTAKELLGLVAALYKVDGNPGARHRVSELLELFELTEWQDELVESYSHGMKQRLVLCAALLHRPRVLIVDEPMVGLDPRTARLVKNLLREEARRGNTVFMSTHSLPVAEELCDEIAIIRSGRIVARGSSGELRRQAGEEGDLEQAFLKLTGGEGARHGGSERPA